MTERKPTLAHAQNSLGANLLKALMDEVTRLRQPWQNTAQAEQQQTIERLRNAVHNSVDAAVRQVAALGFSFYTADLESLAVKDDVSLKLTVSKHAGRVDELVAHVGKPLLVVLVDSEQYTAGMEKIKAQADQPQLPLEEPAQGEEPASAPTDDTPQPAAPSAERGAPESETLIPATATDL